MSWTGLKGTINILPQGQNSPRYSYVQHGWSVSAVSSIVSGFTSTHPRWRFYKKHTGPISMPNSWSGPPMSTGAISTIGSLAVFCVLYSNTVLPQLPFACCKTNRSSVLRDFLYSDEGYVSMKRYTVVEWLVLGVGFFWEKYFFHKKSKQTTINWLSM